MKYAYEDLSSTQFEVLIVLLCQKLFGISVQGFATGPDGGRDAKFIGTAELHPSKASPWAGITIIQAKHTNGYNRSFSETDFFSDKSENTMIGEEVPRIKNLRAAKDLDHYILFANRRLSAKADAKIRSHISTTCAVPISSLYLCGLEQLELWLKQFNDVPKLANLDPIDSPLVVSPDELAEVVEALAENKAEMAAVLDDPPAPRVAYDEKNKMSGMSADYAKELRKRFLKETRQIQTFLAAPENVAILKCYEAVADELQLKIVAKKKSYQSFDNVMNYVVDLLFARDAILRKHKRLTRAVVFYMYWHCDIGNTADATTDETLAS